MSALPREPEALLAAALDGNRRAIARMLSIIERGGQSAQDLGALVHGRGDAYTVGVTGAPGAGKSTLTSALIDTVRSSGSRVAVLAIDPSSPFTGGAILGDRVRMQDHSTDDAVFIRSMATRGHLGGLALAAPQAVRVLSAVGFPWVIVETVGVGQVEVEIVGHADTTVVVVNPGWGDAVQANKAGLMEIADIFVINKSDRPGSADTQRDLEQMLDLTAGGTWRPPILSTVATDGAGVSEVWAAVAEHRSHLQSSGELERRRSARLREELTRIVAERLLERARSLAGTDRFAQLLGGVDRGDISPWDAADELLG